MTEDFNGDLPIWQMTIVGMNGTTHMVCGLKADLIGYIDAWIEMKDEEDPPRMIIRGHSNTCDRAETVLAIRPDYIAAMHVVHYC